MDRWMDESVKGGVGAALSLLSCSNLFCLINSFYPSGWSDSSRCAVCPTSQQPLLSSLSLSLSLSTVPLFLSRSLGPPAGLVPSLHASGAAVRKQSRHAVAMVTITLLQDSGQPQAAKSPKL